MVGLDVSVQVMLIVVQFPTLRTGKRGWKMESFMGLEMVRGLGSMAAEGAG